MAYRHTVAAAMLCALAGCADSRATRNPYPEGRDTVDLRAVGVVAARADSLADTVRILAFDVSPSGEVAVAHADGVVEVRRATHFSSFRVTGGEGQLPIVSGIGVLADGRIAIREASSGRVSIHRPDGGEDASWPTSPGRPPHGWDALLVSEDGTLFVGLRPALTPGAPPVPFPRPVYERLTPTGQVLDTLWVGQEVTRECPDLSEGHFRAGWFEDIRSRYLPKPLWAVGRSGTLVVGCPARYEFTVRGPGTRDLVVSRSWRPHAVSGRERTGFVHLWTVQMTASGVHEEWEWRGPALPETRPAYQRILPAEGGRLWVWPAQPAHQEPAPPDWPLAGLPAILWTEATTGAFDVFETDGSLLGHVRLPSNIPYSGQPNTPDPVIRGDTLWAVTSDENGAQRVERFLVPWDPRRN